TLAGLMTLESAAANEVGVDSAWRGAEAYHFWLLAHRQLYGGNVDLAMRTALHLREYEDLLDPVEIYSFLALAAFYNQFFGQCSKAFIKLESMPSIPADKREAFADLAMSIFLKHPPADPRALRETRTKKGGPGGGVGGSALDALLEDLGGGKEQVCVASGRIVRDGNVVRCKTCKHLSITHELHGSSVCPLCHGTLERPAVGGRGVGGGGVGGSSGKAPLPPMYGGY
ncbi:hypothetical protein Agub_g10705, partial [Astrephomene gubernaculifera]